MSIWDIGISIFSCSMVLFTIPTILNRKSQVPRLTSSLPLALALSVYVPLFIGSGLVLTAITVGGQAVTWWLIVVFRPTRNETDIALKELTS